MYDFNTAADKAVIRPVAIGYRNYTPGVFQDAVRNFFSNLNDVVVFVNDLLQFKVVQAMQDSSRIAYNTTFGLFGLINFTAYMDDLPKHNEDFGQTLGVWGFDPGPYLVIPLLGPSSTRGAVGLAGDLYVNPLTHGILQDDYQQWGAVALAYISLRADALGTTNVLEQAAIDPYVFTRDAYFQYRRNLVYDGNPPPEDNEFNELNLDSDQDAELQQQLKLEDERSKKKTAIPNTPESEKPDAP
jgi:phospholipid-binding lipoprotein MlaA